VVWLDQLLYPLLKRYIMRTTYLLADPSRGRIRLSLAKYQAMLDEAGTEERRAWLLGHSPGMAASLANVSRQAIHDAIDRGRLTALYVYDDRGDLCSILIPPHSLEHYLQTRAPSRGRPAA
jgi:predicted DNA-binding protein YlxM (UPF0122 family)